jgi:hypothetical protein
MTLELVGIISLALGFIGIFCGIPFIVYMFWCSTLLGSAAAFTLPALGGTNISPSHLLLGFLAFKLLSMEKFVNRISGCLSLGLPGFWLMLLLFDGLLSAYFMPRIFAGQTYIFPVRTTGYSEPLQPAISNLTQSIYLIGDFVCFILVYAYATIPGARRILGSAALATVTLNLVFALLDLATYYSNTTVLLSFIRNASYGMLTEVELAGSKRLVGSFSEASSFGSMTLGFFAFSGKLWLLGIRPRLTATLAGLSFFAVLLSKSSTGYIGLAAIVGFAYAETMIGAVRRQLNSQCMWFVAGITIVLPIIALALALNDEVSAYVQDLLDQLLFNKMSSGSGAERSSWNRQGFQNLIDTFGFGVGNGSMRASSFPIAVLASLGIIGALIMGMFLFSVFFSGGARKDADRLDAAYGYAARYTCLAWLITQAAAGAMVDLGLPFFLFAVLACTRSNMSSFPSAYGRTQDSFLVPISSPKDGRLNA